jgi:O-methyltransferase
MMAQHLREVCPARTLHLFDTFDGIPFADPEKDLHEAGDFSDTDVESVAKFVGRDGVTFWQGNIPGTFDFLKGSRFSFVHIDVDVHPATRDCLEFFWPRLNTGGFIVVDDYGFTSCPGAKRAVDEFYDGHRSVPLCLSTGQAIVFKSN